MNKVISKIGEKVQVMFDYLLTNFMRHIHNSIEINSNSAESFNLKQFIQYLILFIFNFIIKSYIIFFLIIIIIFIAIIIFVMI
jgi:hypothetical protein